MGLLIAAKRNGGVVALLPPAGCTTSLLSLSASTSFFNASNALTPPQGCCSAFTSVMETSATCLCQLFSSPTSTPIDQTQVLSLRGACSITTPQCKGVPATAPSASTDVSGTTIATDGASTLTSEAPPANFPSIHQ